MSSISCVRLTGRKTYFSFLEIVANSADQLLQPGDFVLEPLYGWSQLSPAYREPIETLLEKLNRQGHAVERIGELMADLRRRATDGGESLAFDKLVL